MTTALTVYLTEVASGSTLTTADVLATTTGGTLTNHTSLVGTATGYGEIYSQGNTGAWAAAGSIGSPSGHGWLLDATTLEGQQIVSGNWTPTLQFNTNSGTVSCDIHVRAYVRSSGGTYTQIGSDMILSGQSITTSTASYAFSATSEALANFGTGDKLYIDIWLNVSSGGASNTTVKVYGTSSSSQGNTSAQIVTPGYQVGVTTSTRTIPATVALLQTNTRTIPASAALLATLTRTIPTSTALLQTSTRTIPAAAALSIARTIPATAALLATSTRTIPSTVALTNTFTRTIPASAALYQPAVFYASNVVQTAGGLTQSDFMSQIVGGTETSFTVTAPASGTNAYLELTSQGGTPGTNPALPAPTGKGWSINLAGNTILMGSWFSTFTLAKSGTSMSGASLIVRWYRRTIDGVYYPIGSSTLTSQTFSTTKTTYTTPSVSASLWQFIAGDTLYMDAFVFNASAAWASDVWTVYVSNSASLGVVNDGTITAPEMIATPAGLSCLIGASSFQTGTGIPVKDQSFTLADALDQRSILTLTGEDVLGNLSYIPASPVMLSDHDQGLLYTGYLNSDKFTKPAAGGPAQLEHQMTFADHHRDYDKEANETNYLNWSAGDMACDFILQTQNKNGITGAFALESDYTPTTFGQGALTNTVATTTTTPFSNAPNTAIPPVTSNTGDLEITAAGTAVTITESTTSDFASGALTNCTAASNALTPNTVSAVRVQAEIPLQGLASVEIWSGGFTVTSNDTLNYDIFISSTSPGFIAGIDLLFSDGTLLSSYGNSGPSTSNPFPIDQNGVQNTYVGDLTNDAKDTWYTRTVSLAFWSGKTINQVLVYFSSSAAGVMSVYVKNCYLGSQSGSPFFSTSATNTNVNPAVVTDATFVSSLITTTVVQVYNPLTVSRISPAHSISGVGLVRSSSISWITSFTAGTSGIPSTTNTVSPTSVIYVSYDNTTWLLCSQNIALPGLPAGANVAGLSLYLQETFTTGSDPTAIPSLLQVNITLKSAANQTTSDITATYGNATEWNTGTMTYTTTNANGDLILGTLLRDWNDNLITNQSFFPGAGATQSSSSGVYTMTASGSSNATSRLDFAGIAADFTLECDMKVGSSSTFDTIVTYRQTGFGTGRSNYAYAFLLQSGGGSNSLFFGYGSNSSSSSNGTFTQLAASNPSVTTGTFYHVKIVVAGSRHQIYFNNSGSPTFDIFDSTYTSPGYFGFSMASVTSGSTSWDNFKVTPTVSGLWQSPSISLNSLGTCGNSQVAWTAIQANGQPSTSVFAQTSLDSGTTWSTCVNGAGSQTSSSGTTLSTLIPGLAVGTSVSGKSLLIRLILAGATNVTSPVVMGLYARVCGTYGTVTGTRISPALSLSPVGYVASSNCMWNANIPTSTTLTVQTTQDLSTYHTVGSNGAGEALPYWTNQPGATQDLFASNTGANYTNTSKSGGSAGSVGYDIPNSRISFAGGSSALYLNNAISCSDVDEFVDMDWSDAGGLVWRKVDASNYYELGVYDASSSSGFTNQLRLYKVTSGTRNLLGSASSITFTRSTFHRVRVTMEGGLINIYWDGACVQSYLDTSPLAAGACGLRNDGGTSWYYQLWIQPLGTNLTGQVLYTKVTMTTTDPAQMPQLFTLVACVRGATIATGATISQLHPITTPFASYYSTEMDTCVQASGDFYWYVNKWKQLFFGPRMARPGAFPVQSIDDVAKSSGSLLYQPQVSVLSSADLFRNQQLITDVTSLVTPPAETKVADGSTTSWTMGYPLYSAPTILVNGQGGQTVGVQGIDNNRQFYWQPGSASISYDSTLPKLPSGTILSFTYVGQSTANVPLNNSSSQTAQAAIELNSGIVAEIESALKTATKGMTTAQATTFGNGLLSRYGSNNTIEMIGTTRYPGLAPGTVIPLFLPEMMNTWNAQVPIVKVTTTAYQGQNGIIYLYSVDATNGPNLSLWSRVWF